MGDERWIKVAEDDLRSQHENTTYMRVAHRWARAEGQLVFSPRWCRTHTRPWPCPEWALQCVSVTATLILPPEAVS